MKRLILLLTIIYPFGLFAQEASSYRPFIEEGKMWYITGDDSYFRHYIEGDTIVAGRACKKWMQQEGYIVGGEEFKAVYAYEEDKKVWFFYEGDTVPRLMFDFGAEVGDTLVVWQPCAHSYDNVRQYEYWQTYFPKDFTDTLLIQEVSYVKEGGRIQRKVLYSDVDQNHKSNWTFMYEGIGSRINPNFNQSDKKPHSPVLQLLACFIDDEMLYYDELAERWNIPLPTSITAPHSDTFSENRSLSLAPWTDLSGRHLSSPPSRPGLYIKDGRKVMIK